MKLNSIAFANAAAAITALFYIGCTLLSLLAPDFIIGLAQSWVHSLNLEALKALNGFSFSAALWGLVTISALTWATTWATIELYNRWVKN